MVWTNVLQCAGFHQPSLVRDTVQARQKSQMIQTPQTKVRYLSQVTNHKRPLFLCKQPLIETAPQSQAKAPQGSPRLCPRKKPTFLSTRIPATHQSPVQSSSMSVPGLKSLCFPDPKRSRPASPRANIVVSPTRSTLQARLCHPGYRWSGGIYV